MSVTGEYFSRNTVYVYTKKNISVDGVFHVPYSYNNSDILDDFNYISIVNKLNMTGSITSVMDNREHLKLKFEYDNSKYTEPKYYVIQKESRSDLP